MTNMEEKRLDLPADLAGFEARLAQNGPKIAPARLERVKAAALLTLCRESLRHRDPLTGPLLAETIVKSGEERISLSLKQYVRQVRISATLAGFCVGAIVGAVGIVALTAMLARPVPPPSNPAPTASQLRNVSIWGGEFNADGGGESK